MKKNDEKALYIKNKEQEIEKKMKELDEKQNNFDIINERYSLLEKQNKELENNISILKKQKEKLHEEIKQFEGQISNQNDIIKIKNNLNNEINNLKQQLNQKEKEIENNNLINKKQIEKLGKENNILNMKNIEIENDLKKLKNKNNELEQKQKLVFSIKTKEQDIEKLNKDLKEQENILNNLRNEYKILTKQNGELKKNNSDLTKDKDNLMKEISTLEKKLTNQKNIINLNRELEKMKIESKQKDKEIENNNNLNKKEINKIKEEKNILEKLNKEKDKEIIELKEENKKMKRYNTSGQLLQKKEQEISQKMKELEQKENNVLKLYQQYKDLENNISELKNQQNKLINDIKQKKDEHQRLINQMPNNNNIIINNRNQPNPPQNQNQINQNNNFINPINNQSFQNNQQNLFQNKNMQMFPMPNIMFPVFNQNSPIPMANFDFMTPNPMGNNNNFIQNFNTNLPNISSFNPISTFAINITPPARKPTGAIATYRKPTLIGLNNIGSTCYKNSVLQCLSQTHDLTNYFLKGENKEKIINNNIAKKHNRELQLCPIYYELIQNLWKKHASFKSFSPFNFMKSIEDMTKNDTVQFTLHEAGDAKDFILYILERMHTELKKPISNKTPFNTKNAEVQLNQYNKDNALSHFISEFQKETSIISDIFYGCNETTNVCQFCKNKYNSKGQNEPICYNYGIFNILIFPLDEVRKFRDQFYQAKNTQMVSLFDCFCYNQKSDYFTGDNKNYCNICKQLYDSVYTSKIFVASNVLIMILNRGKGNVFKIKIDFSVQINISDFVLQKDKNNLYNLYGVITHLGESGPSAHFVAACRSPVDGNWYRYNDAIVTPINDFQKEVHDFGNPYILFYEKQVQK